MLSSSSALTIPESAEERKERKDREKKSNEKRRKRIIARYKRVGNTEEEKAKRLTRKLKIGH